MPDVFSTLLAWLIVAPLIWGAVLMFRSMMGSTDLPADGGGRGRPWGSGSREPRRPVPLSGSGSVALPFRDDDDSELEPAAGEAIRRSAG